MGAAELAVVSALDFAAHDVRGELHAVADAEDGYTEVEDCGVAGGRAVFVDAAGAAGEDDALGVHRGEFLRGDLGRDKPREDASLAHAAGDELRGLRAEVEDGDDFVALRFGC